ncbi:hypothetical protein ACFW9N_39045 [Streptomyces sp. NPDC059496]|uniref:hypothetical protein n=1 Tax=Streptomyces sp. NPDC059496 TaxID=3346851 RepID=UPI0036CB55B0
MLSVIVEQPEEYHQSPPLVRTDELQPRLRHGIEERIQQIQGLVHTLINAEAARNVTAPAQHGALAFYPSAAAGAVAADNDLLQSLADGVGCRRLADVTHLTTARLSTEVPTHGLGQGRLTSR